MSQIYSVYKDGECRGRVCLEKKGLYYNIDATCSDENREKLHLIAESNDGCTDLGILIPDGRGSKLKRVLPIKQIGTENLRFHLRNAENPLIEVQADKPFLCLEQLENASLQCSGSKLFIRIVNN